MKMLKNIDRSFVCKPIDSYTELQKFVEEPPAWRTLCKELTVHSKYKVRNMDLNKRHPFSLEEPEPFCHYDPADDEPERRDHKDLPITLVCHDMANGYHDDSYIDGTTNYGAYTFYNWAGIDIFCYFSHHLITIPPLSWINVGHAHGVKVIGTVISEWAEGMVFWEHILESETRYREFASTLVAIAKTLKFDGWLLNIENKINKPAMLIEFVRFLRELLHQELKHAVLVWYDSVTVKGNLNWQNGLNEKNKVFFEVSDYFFTNYSWTKNQVAASAQEAGERLHDLCIGIDVWGRNFYAGGQFNVFEAVRVAHEAGCSLAVFAPAWTHEALSPNKDDPNYVSLSDDMDVFQQFNLRERALWNSVWPFLYTKMPCNLPFQTSFCKGQGRKRWLYGEVISPGGWVNLRHQQYQVGAPGPHGYLLSRADIIRRLRHRHRSDENLRSFLQIRSDLHPSQNLESMTLRDLLEDFLDSSRNSRPNSAEEPPQDTIQPEVIRDEDPIKPSAEQPSSSKELGAHVPPSKKKQPGKFKTAIMSMFSKLKPHKNPTTEKPNSISCEPKVCSDEVKIKSDDSIEKDEVAAGEGSSSRRDSSLQDQSSAPEVQRTSVFIRLRHEEEQTRWALSSVPQEKECLQVYLEDAFTGGSCLCIHPSDDICSEHRNTRLLFCDFLCEDTLVFCVVTKNLADCAYQYLHMLLSFVVGSERKHVVLVGWHARCGLELKVDSEDIKHFYPLDPQEAPFEDLRKYLLIHEPGFYVSADNQYGWNVLYYTINKPGWRLLSINCRTRMGHGPILLGHLGICKLDQNKKVRS